MFEIFMTAFKEGMCLFYYIKDLWSQHNEVRKCINATAQFFSLDDICPSPGYFIKSYTCMLCTAFVVITCLFAQYVCTSLLTSHCIEIRDWRFWNTSYNSYLGKSCSEVKGSFSWAGDTAFDFIRIEVIISGNESALENNKLV